jgi:HSP20 family protein
MTSKRDLDEMIQDLWRVPRFSGQRAIFQPPVDFYRRPDPPELHVVVELPGIDPADVNLVIEGGALTVSGERSRPRVDFRPADYPREIEYGAFQRRLALPEDADVAGTRATYDRGMLTIVVPIAAKPRTLEKVSIQVRGRR